MLIVPVGTISILACDVIDVLQKRVFVHFRLFIQKQQSRQERLDKVVKINPVHPVSHAGRHTALNTHTHAWLAVSTRAMRRKVAASTDISQIQTIKRQNSKCDRVCVQACLFLVVILKVKSVILQWERYADSY